MKGAQQGGCLLPRGEGALSPGVLIHNCSSAGLGFIVSRHENLRADFMRDMSQWVQSGQVQYRETRYEGLAQAPQAFIGLFSGANTGKMIVHLAD